MTSSGRGDRSAPVRHAFKRIARANDANNSTDLRVTLLSVGQCCTHEPSPVLELSVG